MPTWEINGANGGFSKKTKFSSAKRKGNSRPKDADLKSHERISEDDLNSATHHTQLLFPEESKEPLFPELRSNFFVMTVKRTLFGCRGLILLCLIVFIIITIVSSQNTGNSILQSSQSEKHSEKNDSSVSDRRNFSVLMLPPPLNGTRDASYVNVTFNSQCIYGKKDFAVIGNALRKGLQFYGENIDNITVLDAALGTKIVSEQLKTIRHTHGHLPVEVSSFVHSLENLANMLTEKITDTVKRHANSTEELKLTLPWVQKEGLWELPTRQWYGSDTLKSYNPKSEESFEELWNIVARKEIIDESESDACIYEVFHCDKNNITERCKLVFLNQERSMYSLTHQVIYMLLVQKNKCFSKPGWEDVPNLKQSGYPFMEKLCGKVWQEANSIEEANFPPRFRDLFVEQIGICGLAGYADFFRRDWLRRILSWQSISTSGCFADRRRRLPSLSTLIQEYHRLHTHKDSPQTNDHVNRDKRSEMLLASGDNSERCSVHFTSVGLTALSLHLHYLTDTCLNTY